MHRIAFLIGTSDEQKHHKTLLFTLVVKTSFVCHTNMAKIAITFLETSEILSFQLMIKSYFDQNCVVLLSFRVRRVRPLSICPSMLCPPLRNFSENLFSIFFSPYKCFSMLMAFPDVGKHKSLTRHSRFDTIQHSHFQPNFFFTSAYNAIQWNAL